MTKLRILLAALMALGLSAGPALPQAAQALQGGRAVSGDATIAAGGTPQVLFGGLAPVRGWSVGNPNASDDLWCSDSATAAVNGLGSYRIPANGGFYATPMLAYPGGVVSCVGPTTGDKVTARRW